MAQTKKRGDEHLSPPDKLDKFPFYGYELDDEQLIFANSIWDSGKDIIFCNACAGTGKTTVATGVANIRMENASKDGCLEQLQKRAQYILKRFIRH